MTGPEDETGAGRRGHVRAAHADREQVIETLKAAFTQGRLDKDEFDLRVSQAFASRTYAELAAVTVDIPAGLTTAKPAALARPQGERPARWPGSVLTVATVLYAGAWAFVPFYPSDSGSPPAGPLVFLAGPLYMVILTLCVAQMVASWQEKRSGGQPPGRPGERRLRQPADVACSEHVADQRHGADERVAISSGRFARMLSGARSVSSAPRLSHGL